MKRHLASWQSGRICPPYISGSDAVPGIDGQLPYRIEEISCPL